MAVAWHAIDKMEAVKACSAEARRVRHEAIRILERLVKGLADDFRTLAVRRKR
jgi:hypothetical protein